MIRFAALLATTLFCTNAIADGIDSRATTSPSSTVSTEPGEGRVALNINVTETRRVMVRDDDAPSQMRFVCSTPCRLYVAPGNVDVTLVGWGAHEYHWEVPMHGGSVNLRANPMPAELVAARAAEAHRIELEAAAARAAREEAIARTAMMFSLVSVGGAAIGLTHSISLLDVLADDGSL